MPRLTLEQMHGHPALVAFAVYAWVIGCGLAGALIAYRLTRPRRASCSR